MHPALIALVDIRHGVLRDQYHAAADRLPVVQQFANAPMIGIEDFLATRGDFRGAQADIAGNLAQLADAGNRCRNLGVAVAVDHQPGIILRYQRRIDQLRPRAAPRSKRRYPRRYAAAAPTQAIPDSPSAAECARSA